jgi:transposase
MAEIVTIGLDIAKSVFQVHGVDAAGQVVVRRRLRRSHVLKFFAGLAPCVVGVEACATSHHWSRQLQALGHSVKLMPPSYVKPYVKRQKNDMADAEAICEAVMRPTMRFVETKTPEQQSVLMLHRIRLMLVGQRTMLSNTIRAHMAEFGIVAPIGRRGLDELLAVLSDLGDERVPALARDCLVAVAEQLMLVKAKILDMDRRIAACHRSSEMSRRLAEIPGIGPLLATALVATVPDPRAFASARNFAAWIGLVPKQNSSGRQGAARRHHQAGQQIPALDADGRGAGGHPICRAARHKATVDHQASRPPADQACRRGARQQDGADGLGDHGQERTISRTGRCCGLKVKGRQ